MITLTRYLEQRLGKTSQEQAKNFLGKPFTAPTLSTFWTYWNPVWNYYLYYYCYARLNKHFSRMASILLTFAISGFLHDLPFVISSWVVGDRQIRFTITLFLFLNGLLVIITEITHLRWDRIPPWLRWPIHVAVLVTTYLTATHLQETQHFLNHRM